MEIYRRISWGGVDAIYTKFKNVPKRNYRIVEHDSSHNCSSSKEKDFITNTLHAVNSDQSYKSNIACLVYNYMAIALDLNYRLQLEKLT